MVPCVVILFQEYRNTLYDLLLTLEASLAENRGRQRQLQAEIRDLEANRRPVEDSMAFKQPLHINAREETALADTAVKKTTVSVFASPYFKAGFFWTRTWLGTLTMTMSRDVPDIHWDRADFCQWR